MADKSDLLDLCQDPRLQAINLGARILVLGRTKQLTSQGIYDFRLGLAWLLLVTRYLGNLMRE